MPNICDTIIDEIYRLRNDLDRRQLGPSHSFIVRTEKPNAALMKSNLPPTTHAERLAAVREWEEQSIAKYGFFVHMVIDGAPAGLTNFHTHGFDQTWNYPDLQIVVNVGQSSAMGLFHLMADRCRTAFAAGQPCPFEVGKVYDDIAEGFDTAFIEATECGRRVLRLIVPDASGSLDPSELTGVFAAQFEHLDL